MSTKKTTVLMAAVLAAATVLAAGLVAFPGSIQEAQANPYANDVDSEDGGTTTNSLNPQDDDERECDFTGYFKFDED